MRTRVPYDQPCPHCGGANTGCYDLPGIGILYTTRVVDKKPNGGFVLSVYGCGDANRKDCINLRAADSVRTLLATITKGE
jgi:hypothetical protein